MKKILLLFSICLISMLGYAQTNEDGKESVYIDYFSRPGSINNILAEALRNKIIEGIQEMNRVVSNDVDGRADVVAHAAQEARLGGVGTLRLIRRPTQLLLIAAFPALFLRHVLHGENYRVNLPMLVPLLGYDRVQIPFAVNVLTGVGEIGVHLQTTRQRGNIREGLIILPPILAHIGFLNVLYQRRGRLHIPHVVRQYLRSLDDLYLVGLDVNQQGCRINAADGLNRVHLILPLLQVAPFQTAAQQHENHPDERIHRDAACHDQHSRLEHGAAREERVQTIFPGDALAAVPCHTARLKALQAVAVRSARTGGQGQRLHVCHADLLRSVGA